MILAIICLAKLLLILATQLAKLKRFWGPTQKVSVRTFICISFLIILPSIYVKPFYFQGQIISIWTKYNILNSPSFHDFVLMENENHTILILMWRFFFEWVNWDFVNRDLVVADWQHSNTKTVKRPIAHCAKSYRCDLATSPQQKIPKN